MIHARAWLECNACDEKMDLTGDSMCGTDIGSIVDLFKDWKVLPTGWHAVNTSNAYGHRYLICPKHPLNIPQIEAGR